MRIGFGFSVTPGEPLALGAELARAEQGAAEAGRTPDELEVWFTSFWWMDEEPGRAKADGTWSATAFALHFADSGVEGKFLPEHERRISTWARLVLPRFREAA